MMYGFPQYGGYGNNNPYSNPYFFNTNGLPSEFNAFGNRGTPGFMPTFADPSANDWQNWQTALYNDTQRYQQQQGYGGGYGGGGSGFRDMEFRDYNGNGIDDRDEPGYPGTGSTFPGWSNGSGRFGGLAGGHHGLGGGFPMYPGAGGYPGMGGGYNGGYGFPPYMGMGQGNYASYGWAQNPYFGGFSGMNPYMNPYMGGGWFDWRGPGGMPGGSGSQFGDFFNNFLDPNSSFWQGMFDRFGDIYGPQTPPQVPVAPGVFPDQQQAASSTRSAGSKPDTRQTVGGPGGVYRYDGPIQATYAGPAYIDPVASGTNSGGSKPPDDFSNDPVDPRYGGGA